MASLASVLRPQSFMPGAVDPGATSDAPQFASPMAMADKPKPRGRGLLGALGDAFGPQSGGRNWQIIGAALRQLNTGGNDLSSLMERLEQERRDNMAMAWQAQLQNHQLADWKTQDRRTQNEDTLAAAVPPGPDHDLAVTMPHEYASARITEMVRPHMVDMTTAQLRARGYQPGTVGQINNQTGEVNVTQSPYHPPAAMIIGGNNTQDDVSYVADIVQSQGQQAATPFFQRNPQLAQAVVQELARRRAGGDRNADPNAVGLAHATYRANSTSLSQLTTQGNAIERAGRAVRSNMTTALRLTSSLARSGSPLANRWTQAAQSELQGNPDIAAARASLEGTLSEYARILTGAYGAGGTPVTELSHIREMLSTANTQAQITNAFGAMQELMNNVDQSYVDQRQELSGTMRGGGQTGPPQQRTRTYNPQTGRLE